jgi:hypothetical protein
MCIRRHTTAKPHYYLFAESLQALSREYDADYIVLHNTSNITCFDGATLVWESDYFSVYRLEYSNARCARKTMGN